MIRLVCILSILAGCAGGSVKAPEPVADPEWYTKDFLSFNEHGSSMDLGNMNVTGCGNQAMYDYLDATRERREALAARLNGWYNSVDRGVLTQLVNGVHPQIVITNLPDHVGKPFKPFLSPETLAAEDREYFLERVADDLAFAERALGTSLNQFRSHVSRVLEEKIKHYLEPREPDHAEIIDDTTPVPESSQWLDSLTSSIDVTQEDAEDRLKQVEEDFELKKSTMSQSEIEEFELQLRIAKEALRYLKEQTEEFKRLVEDE